MYFFVNLYVSNRKLGVYDQCIIFYLLTSVCIMFYIRVHTSIFSIIITIVIILLHVRNTRDNKIIYINNGNKRVELAYLLYLYK